MNKSEHKEQSEYKELSEYLLRPMIDMNKRDLEKLSKSKLIKMLLRPIGNIPDLETLENIKSSFYEHGIFSNFEKRTKSEIIRLLLKKEKNRPKIQINVEEMTCEMEEHIPGSNVTIEYVCYLKINIYSITIHYEISKI